MDIDTQKQILEEGECSIRTNNPFTVHDDHAVFIKEEPDDFSPELPTSPTHSVKAEHSDEDLSEGDEEILSDWDHSGANSNSSSLCYSITPDTSNSPSILSQSQAPAFWPEEFKGKDQPLTEADEKRRQKLARAAERMRHKRASETEEQRQQRLSRMAERMRLKRRTGERDIEKLTRDAERMRAKRAAESEEQRKARLARDAQRVRAKRAAETEEQRAARRARDAERMRAKRMALDFIANTWQAELLAGELSSCAVETMQQRAERLRKDAERMRLKRASETQEQRQARLARCARRMREKRALESDKDRKARLARDVERHRFKYLAKLQAQFEQTQLGSVDVAPGTAQLSDRSYAAIVHEQLIAKRAREAERKRIKRAAERAVKSFGVDSAALLHNMIDLQHSTQTQNQSDSDELSQISCERVSDPRTSQLLSQLTSPPLNHKVNQHLDQRTAQQTNHLIDQLRTPPISFPPELPQVEPTIEKNSHLLRQLAAPPINQQGLEQISQPTGQQPSQPADQRLLQQPTNQQTNRRSVQQSGRKSAPGTSNSSPFKCTICNKTFCNKYVLQAHLNRHNGVKPFTCADCGRGFSYRTNLVAHTQTHAAAALAHTCDVCGMAFVGPEHLSAHRATHYTARLQCPTEGCSERFVDHIQLGHHLVLHTRLKPTPGIERSGTQQSHASDSSSNNPAPGLQGMFPSDLC